LAQTVVVDIPVNVVWVGFWADDEFAIVLLEVGVKVDVVGSGTVAAMVLDSVSIGIGSTTAEDCMELLGTIVLELPADEVLLEVGKAEEAAFPVWLELTSVPASVAFELEEKSVSTHLMLWQLPPMSVY
jgi:hypothetical protein